MNFGVKGKVNCLSIASLCVTSIKVCKRKIGFNDMVRAKFVLRPKGDPADSLSHPNSRH